MPRSAHRSLRVLALLAALALAGGAAAAPPTLDQGLSLESIGSPAISPDGRWVVYERQRTDWKENAYVRQLWLAAAAGGRDFQLTRGKEPATGAQWSPDGRWIAFFTHRESGAIVPPESTEPEAGATAGEGEAEPAKGEPAERQIWLISPAGGEAWMLTEHGAEIQRFAWSKDARSIAFVAPEPEGEKAEQRAERYGDYRVVERDFRQGQLWSVDVAAAEKDQLPAAARQLTADPALDVGGLDWSPDSKWIAFDATPDPLLAHGGESDVYLLDLEGGGGVHRVVGLPGPDGDPMFSPDGTSLAFTTSLGERYYYYANEHLATVEVASVLRHPATRAADVRDLTADFDEDANPVAWAPGGIFFAALQKTSAHLFRVDPASGAVTRLTAPDDLVLRAAAVAPDGRSAAWIAGDADHLPELWVTPLPAPSPRRLTDLTSQVAGWTLGSTEVISWKSQDGTRIEGVLHRPADFQAGRRAPLLVVIHGGPTGISLPNLRPDSRYYPVEQFLAKGALVLEPNYRGSAGYGAAFRALNVRNLGVGDQWDVVSGVDALIARGLVDGDRVGVMGWSQGGYISAFLTTNSDRFAAVSVGAGISDWTTYYVNTDITPFTRQYLHATPWDDPEIYARTSPITHIRQATTPTLIQHGGEDARVPIPNGFELYRGLRDQEVPVTMVVYPGYGHPITKPKSNRAVLQTNLDWFSHYLWDEPIPEDSPLRGSGEVPAAPADGG